MKKGIGEIIKKEFFEILIGILYIIILFSEIFILISEFLIEKIKKIGKI